MVTHSSEAVVRLTVWVPVHGETRVMWRPSQQIAQFLGEQQVRSCREVEATMEMQALLVSRLISPRSRSLATFRLQAKTRDTNDLVGLVEWHRSDETGKWLPGDVWTSCQYGQHCGMASAAVSAA